MPKQTRFALAIGLLLCLGAAPDVPRPPPVPPGPLGERDISIVNHSPRSIVELYVSPSTEDAWGADRLGDRQIDSGARTQLSLGRTRECGFDILAIYDDASRDEIRDANLCRLKLLTLDGSQATPPPLPHQTVTIINASKLPIQQLFISPPDAAQWGDDLLTTAGLSVAEHRDITYDGTCEADVRAVFTNRAAEERRGLNLCTHPVLTISPGWTTADAP
jgi:hypothetical protein